MSIIEKLTEGIIGRNVQKEGEALLNKWEKTGLMEGIEGDHGRNTMACLLENQAKELLREVSAMEAGNVEGFAAVAFPIVRRVFGALVANELVSVQPMSLPSGLIFFLDFTYGNTRLGETTGKSLYGGNVVGSEITGGVDLETQGNTSFYGLVNGYSSPTGSSNDQSLGSPIATGTFGGVQGVSDYGGPAIGGITGAPQEEFDALCQFDADFISGTTNVAVYKYAAASLTQFNKSDLSAIACVGSGSAADISGSGQARRLSAWSGSAGPAGMFKGRNEGTNQIYLYFYSRDGAVSANALISANSVDLSWVQTDNFTSSATTGAVIGTTAWGLEDDSAIPEINIKVDSVSITAVTKKLKARWTPELQQDINAYHNLDAEVELTGILSEHIALEIDQEILEDLVKDATGAIYYWSRKPGKFVNREAGGPIVSTLYPDFTGTVSEWYETLLETVNDVSAAIHRKTLRGGANFLVTSPEIANLLEFTSGFRADTTADENRGSAGAVKVGQISKKWDVYVDPYFLRNVILVGRKGNSFLESGYVYAPYVPLQITPTIFGPDDFTPRKGVMTRYGKKMVRPDYYGLVIVEDLLG